MQCDYSRDDRIDQDITIEFIAGKSLIERSRQTPGCVEQSNIWARRQIAQFDSVCAQSGGFNLIGDKFGFHQYKQDIDAVAHLAIEDLARLAENHRSFDKRSLCGGASADFQGSIVLRQRKRDAITWKEGWDRDDAILPHEAADRQARETVP
ncbi:MAG: hypothetical protein WDN50_20540 [Bradyrhizobium sp.]